MIDIPKQIVQWLSGYYGLRINKVELLALGADYQASVYRAESAEGKPYFVKVRQGPFSEAHFEAMELLQQAGVSEIIAPIRTREGMQAQQAGEYSLIVYPFIEAESGFGRALSDRQWVQFGKALRRVHEIEVPAMTQKRIRREHFSPQWRDAVSAFCLQELGKGDEIGTKFRAFVSERKGEIEELLSRAKRLAKQIENETFPFVLCHSDIHAGNLLLGSEEIFYLIDWDDPIMAPRERDLMFIGAGVGNVWNLPYEETLFYEGYGKIELNRVLLAYYRHERILEDIAIYAKELLAEERSNKEREEMYGHFVAMFEPRGVVEIALESECK